MVVKINISLPEDVLKQIDKASEESHLSRSGLLVQAAKRYLEEREQEKLKEKRRKAAEGIDRIREKLGNWDATGEILKWRQLH